jgi:hypothetical protein
MTTQNQLNSPEPFVTGKGGTGVASVTIAPTATAFAGWDANKNLSANNHIEGYTSTVTSGTTITLTVSSTQQQFLTGSTAQTFVMPLASTLVEGMSWYIVNQSSAIITVQSSGGNTIIAMAANTTAVVTCILNSGTTASSWFAEYEQSQLVLPLPLVDGGTGQSFGTVDNAVFSTNGSGVAQLSATLPTSIAVTTPQITTGINDANGNSILSLSPVASAVNSFQMFNNSAGNTPILFCTGSDANIGMTLETKGTGAFSFTSQATSAQLVFNMGTIPVGNTFSFPVTVGYAYTWPAASGTVGITSTGTWTPIDASGASLTFTAVSGRYIQIGNVVIATAQLTYPSTSNASAAVIGGLPVTTGSTNEKMGGTIVKTTVATLAHCTTLTSNTTFGLYTTAGVGVLNSAMSLSVNTFQVIYFI